MPGVGNELSRLSEPDVWRYTVCTWGMKLGGNGHRQAAGALAHRDGGDQWAPAGRWRRHDGEPGARSARSAPPTRRNYSGICGGTLGELYQGPYWVADEPSVAIISLPVDKFVSCHFNLTEGRPGRVAGRQWPNRARCARAVELFASRYGVSLPSGHWEYHSELEVGKGMASSTADLVATIRCLYDIFALPYDEAGLRSILGRIERSDPVFLAEFALYLSGQQRVVRRLGNRIGYFACYVVEPSMVDTEAVGRRLLRYYARHRSEYKECADSMISAFSACDAVRVAQASSWSARLSQGVVPKASYDEFVRRQRSYGAAGIFVAHTGTIIGYLFSRRPRPATLGAISAMVKRQGLRCRFGRVGWGNV